LTPPGVDSGGNPCAADCGLLPFLVIVDIVALLSSCSLYSLAVNPRNSTKASQDGITHGMLMD
jgi:hypothetical protein